MGADCGGMGVAARWTAGRADPAAAHTGGRGGVGGVPPDAAAVTCGKRGGAGGAAAGLGAAGIGAGRRLSCTGRTAAVGAVVVAANWVGCGRPFCADADVNADVNADADGDANAAAGAGPGDDCFAAFSRCTGGSPAPPAARRTGGDGWTGRSRATALSARVAAPVSGAERAGADTARAGASGMCTVCLAGVGIEWPSECVEMGAAATRRSGAEGGAATSVR